jgi:hypothetical protein
MFFAFVVLSLQKKASEASLGSGASEASHREMLGKRDCPSSKRGERNKYVCRTVGLVNAAGHRDLFVALLR